jgi:nitroreductase
VKEKLSRREFLEDSALATAGLMLTAFTPMDRNSKHFNIEGDTMTAIQLPQPVTSGGRPFMEVVKDRKSGEGFDSRDLSMETLSNLLWAGFGINRPDSGKRTAPSAMNTQEIDIYVLLAAGAYIYDPKANVLNPVVAEDLRSRAAMKPTMQSAPVHLVYIADYGKLKGGDAGMRERFKMYSHAHAGFIGQNIYLFCASEGFSTRFHASFDDGSLRTALKLTDDQTIIYPQVVGYPA